MKAYLISIGEEILIGQTTNTNAAFIGSKLSDINVEIVKSSVVRDNQSEIITELNIASEIADLIVVTGGLGPTHDDITKKVVVDYFQTELIHNEEVLENIKALFEKRGRKLTSINEQQALIPKISKAIHNEYGTAPGMWIKHSEKIFIFIPGVPYEMKSMVVDFIVPELSKITSKSDFIIKRLILQTTGIPESVLFERLGDIEELIKGAELAFLPSPSGVKLRITVTSDSEENANNRLLEIEQKIRGKVGRYIFGRGEEKLEEVIGKLLKERGLTVATAESCTGGNISSQITNISGSSKYFERGVVSYSNAAKIELLKVDQNIILEFGAVSEEVAKQMAQGIRTISGSSIGLSVTGILGPTGSTPDKPVGLVYIGYCDDKICIAKKFMFGEDRIINKKRTTQAALEMLRRNLLGIQTNE